MSWYYCVALVCLAVVIVLWAWIGREMEKDFKKDWDREHREWGL